MSTDDQIKHLTEAAKTAHVDIVTGKNPEGALVKHSKPLTIDGLKAGEDVAFAHIRTKSIDGYYLIRGRIVGEGAVAEVIDSHGAIVAKLPAAVYERGFDSPIATPDGSFNIGRCVFFRTDNGPVHYAGAICGQVSFVITWIDPD